ncbi:MAG: antibiotic biosynthesis monooxygenase [Pseudomonadales bacterium]|jgi:quinol monooxygenase YgiN|tara:strand:- start:216 stop:614 length:399 start_codon:yes stop_codon:yes gene_type:complete
MTTLLAHITIKPGSEAEFEQIMTYMVESTLSAEDGVLRYEYFKGQKPNFYYCLLSFRDKWAFYDHQNSDHHEGVDFGAVIESISLEYLDPVEGANPLTKTIDAPLAPHHSEAMVEAAKRYPLSIADWWLQRR